MSQEHTDINVAVQSSVGTDTTEDTNKKDPNQEDPNKEEQSKIFNENGMNGEKEKDFVENMEDSMRFPVNPEVNSNEINLVDGSRNPPDMILEQDDDDQDIFDDEDDDDDTENEDDAKILNMSLIQSILGNSNNASQNNLFAAETEATRGKSVTFRDVSSVSSAADDEKTHEELIHKIAKLQADLTQATIEVSAEKVMRRKKDKSLVKLAKELNKRAADQASKDKQIVMLKNIIADLDAKLNATRSEMDERIATNERKTKEYNDQLDAAHQRYRSFVQEHDVTVADIHRNHATELETLRKSLNDLELDCETTRLQISTIREQMVHKETESERMISLYQTQSTEAHQQKLAAASEYESKLSDLHHKYELQMEELRHQLLAANLESDRIRTELASFQMKASPEDAANIVEQTMKRAQQSSAALPSTAVAPKSSLMTLLWNLIQHGSIVVVLLVAFAIPMGFLSPDAICAPILPGTYLGAASVSSTAPWWLAKNTVSPQVFGAICGKRPQTSLQWSGGRLIITDITTTKTLLDKRSHTASIHGPTVHLYSKNSKIETLRSPWSR